MKSTKYILVYIDEINKLNFFNRFYPAIIELGYEIIVITNRVSFLLFNWKGNIKPYVVHRMRGKTFNGDIPVTREICDYTLTRREATELYFAIYSTAEKIYKSRNIDHIFIWGGENTAEQATRQFARDHRIQTLFFELANIPGKIFVDSLGTNAGSLIYKDKSLLNNYRTNEEEYEKWKIKYLNLKEQESMPPQSVKRKKLRLSFLIDHLGFKLLHIPFENNINIFVKLKRKIWQKMSNVKYDDYKFENGHFIFLPMQVSNDSQLLFNSKINNVQAIEYASGVAKNKGMDLLVKPHPAEVNPLEYEKVIALKMKLKFYLVNQPTLNILKYCESVITINSTVGLEALLIGKPVEFLGKTFYESLDKERMQNYIMSYLINIDFFGTEYIDKSRIQVVLDRLLL